MRHPSLVVERISKLHMLMMGPFYSITAKHWKATDNDVHPEMSDTLPRYPGLALTLLVFLKKARSDRGTEALFVLDVDLIAVSIACSGHSEALISRLEGLGVLILEQPPTSRPDLDPMAKYFPKLIPCIDECLTHEKAGRLCSAG